MDRTAFKTALQSIASNTNEGKTEDQALEDFIDAVENFIKSATVTVPGTGLVAPGGGGPVTGSSTTGELS